MGRVDPGKKNDNETSVGLAILGNSIFFFSEPQQLIWGTPFSDEAIGQQLCSRVSILCVAGDKTLQMAACKLHLKSWKVRISQRTSNYVMEREGFKVLCPSINIYKH